MRLQFCLPRFLTVKEVNAFYAGIEKLRASQLDLTLLEARFGDLSFTVSPDKGQEAVDAVYDVVRKILNARTKKSIAMKGEKHGS